MRSFALHSLNLLRLALAGIFILAALTCQAAEKEFELNIQNGKVPKGSYLMKVQKGDQIRWKVLSDADGELHIHAYHIDQIIKAKKPTMYSFTATATGRYRVEWHPESERGKGVHHSEPLALLEVYPN